nr:hypothetical protein A6C57_22700 [Fibrella sp. ES10-3-2-2]
MLGKIRRIAIFTFAGYPVHKHKVQLVLAQHGYPIGQKIRVPFVIRIERSDEFAPAKLKPPVTGSGLPLIRLSVVFKAVIIGQHCPQAVGRAIVDDDKLPVCIALGLYATNGFSNQVAPIISRNNDGH